jgi:ribosome recycling factor
MANFCILGYPYTCICLIFQEAEVIKDILKEAESRMNGAIQSLSSDLAVIRTGRASPALVERLSVSYYDTPTPLLQLASISIPEPRSILIKPFDPSTLKDVERAILASDLGLTPNNDGKSIHLNLRHNRRAQARPRKSRACALRGSPRSCA